MKANFKLMLVMLAGVAFIYTGCKKSNSPAPSSIATKNAAISQIATNFYQSLVGSYGGVNVKNGLTSPSFINPNKSLQLNSTSTCGFYIDNGIDYSTNIGDTIKSHSTGNISFYFLCDNNVHVGYNNTDSLHTVGTAPGYTFVYDFTQNYLVKGLNPQNTSISLDGTIKSFVDDYYTSGQTNYVHNHYKLDGLEININDDSNITQGTATFTSAGAWGSVLWDYEGTITFYGDHMAILVVNGITYKVNLKTGVISQ